jgi:predicted PurR-regulated permease PerM
MSAGRQWASWGAALAASLFLVWLLRDILLPFVAAMAVAYLLDPLASRLERWGLPRAAAALAIIAAFFAGALTLAVALLPVAYRQLAGLFERLPDYAERLRELVAPLAARVLGGVDPAAKLDFTAMLGGGGADALALMGRVVVGLLGGGLAVFQLLSLLIITPIVAFYLLRDWDRVVAYVDSCLPRQHAEIIRAQAREIDRVLSGFVRGQSAVCAILALYYGSALSLLGVDFGLAIGLTAGVLAFIPYVGAGIGFIAALGVTAIQFGANFGMLGAVLGVFAAGQLAEGYGLTPRLVGSQVGLHPVWILFGLMAGAALFGFLGMLVAIPLFAVIGVLVRFAIARYLASGLYLGPGRP